MLWQKSIATLFLITLMTTFAHADTVDAAKKTFLKKIIEQQKENRDNANGSKEGFYIKGTGKSHRETVNNRDLIIYTPPSVKNKGDTPLLIVLHGGFGNAAYIQNYIGLDPLADKYGFIVAYLNGTPIAKALPAKMGGWNAGGCCGQPEAKNIDDIGFIAEVIKFAHQKYGINTEKVYGTGHSNGGMMTQRIMCETNLYKSAVSISGTLQLNLKSCPSANGKHLMNIHGTEDENLPVKGGHTVKGFNKKTDYKSQAYTHGIFNKSGATYDLLLLNGADHAPETINAVLWETESMSLPQKIVSYLGLSQK